MPRIVMRNNVDRLTAETEEQVVPRLEVVGRKDAAKKRRLADPLVLPSRLHQRKPRAELAILGWANRAVRLGIVD